MKEILNIISILLYLLVAIISLLMAYRGIFSKKYLPFHEEAAGKPWESIEKPLQNVILTILRISGLGFLILFLLLSALPVFNFFRQALFVSYLIPAISLIYCFGLFLFNYRLFKQTKANTPWKGSVVAMIVILLALILSLMSI